MSCLSYQIHLSVCRLLRILSILLSTPGCNAWFVHTVSSHSNAYSLTCNLNAVLIARIHLAQFIQFLLCNDGDVTPVADILSLLQLYVDLNVFKKIFQVLYGQALPQTVLS